MISNLYDALTCLESLIGFDSTDRNYHTFTMEFFPHEVHFLVDGAVRVRFPDRLIPVSDQRHDYVTLFPRAPQAMHYQFEIDGTPDYPHEKTDFNSKIASGTPAKHFLDYVKVWDLPQSTSATSFPYH